VSDDQIVAGSLFHDDSQQIQMHEIAKVGLQMWNLEIAV